MSVVQFDVFDIDDPNGTPLGTIDDTEAEALDFRVGWRGDPGEGHVRINRHHAAASLIAPDRIYKAKIPAIDSGYLYAFIQKDADYTLASPREEAGEFLELIGPGLKALFAQSRLYWSVYAPGQTARGSANHAHNLWWWINEPYGAIATRVIEEGINQPGTPLADMNPTFTRTHDSDGTPWSNIADEWQTTVGTDVLTVLGELEKHGDFFIEVLPDLTVNAYQVSPGRDLTGTVHVQKGAELMTSLKRRIKGRPAVDHLILMDSDGNYSLETAPGASGRGSWGYYEAPTNDDTTLNKIGQDVIRASRTSLEPIEFEIDPLAYLPGPEGSDNGEYWVADYIAVSTGSGPQDYDEEPHLVTGLRFSLDTAVVDTDATTKARSIRVVVECNVETISTIEPSAGFGGLPIARGVPCRLLSSAMLTPGSATNGDAEDTGGGQWTGGVYTTAHRQAGARAYGSLSALSPVFTYTFDPSQVFLAGVRYVIDVWTDYENDHDVTVITFGDPGVDTESVTYQGAPGNDPPDIWDELAVGADGQSWARGRVCWTPNADRTGVTVAIDLNSHGPTGYIVVDSLTLSTTSASDPDLAGDSSSVASSNHSHVHNLLTSRDAPEAHPASAVTEDTYGDVQAAIDALGLSAGYSDEQAQDAVGGMIADTATVDLVYTDATPELKANVIPTGIKLDDLGTPDDNTDLDASTSQHGLLKKLAGGISLFLRADGTWAAPAGGGGGGTGVGSANLFVGTADPYEATSVTGLFVANQGMFYKYTPSKDVTVSQAVFRVFTQAGNLDFGIYDDALNRLVSTGSFACPAPPGAGFQTQAFSGAATQLLSAGSVYFLAMAASSASFKTATKPGASLGTVLGHGYRLKGVMAAALPLPNPATPTFDAASAVLTPIFMFS